MKIIDYLYILKRKIEFNKSFSKAKQSCKKNTQKVFYIGIPHHSNLGDLAQYLCIQNMLKNQLPDYHVVEFWNEHIYNTDKGIEIIKKNINNKDIFVIQSGYCTTDMGGISTKTCMKLILNFPNNKFVFMPQTINFRSESNKNECSLIYSKCSDMIFLARDKVSYNTAKQMFPKADVRLYPDVVTSLIGTRSNEYTKNGVCFCVRNDSEKYYSDNELNDAIKQIRNKYSVDVIDTTLKKESRVLKNPKKYIHDYIDNLSKYKCVVTDRYHGMIFSLIAGCSVIVLKTKDHKVISGVDWFDETKNYNICIANKLDDIIKIIDSFVAKPPEGITERFTYSSFYKDFFEKAVE